MQATCPNCKLMYTIPAVSKGQTVSCPSCSWNFRVPEVPIQLVRPPATPERVLFWLLLDNTPCGPFETAPIMAMLNSHQVTMETPACLMGQHQWCPLKQLLLATAPPRSPDQTSSENWYYANGKQKLGPFSLPQFKQLAASGTLKPDDMVWREGSAVWVKAGSVADLFSPNLDETRQNNPLQFAVQTPESLPYGDRSKIEKEANPSHLLVDVAKPSLWNPSVASAWSLLLTPIFGAVLHALNWRELRHQNRQLGNIAWAVLYASF